MSKELKPCPHCGGKADFELTEYATWGIRCGCARHIFFKGGHDKSELADLWNGRAERTCKETIDLACNKCGEGIELGPNGTNNYCANCGAKFEEGVES